MKNIVGNIKNRRVAILEQACERYATMVYETLRRELAVGFKSITYSYQGSEEGERSGTFTATLMPWYQSQKLRNGHRSTRVSFIVHTTPDADRWLLSNGRAIDIQSGMETTIRFSPDGRRIAISIPDWNETRYGGYSYDSQHIQPLNQELWDRYMVNLSI